MCVVFLFIQIPWHWILQLIRDRPFNLKGGLWFFVSFRKFSSDNTRGRTFFPEFNIRLYDKNSESDFFFFLHQNQNFFFSNIGNQNGFFLKTITPPFKLNGRSLTWSYIYISTTPCWFKKHVKLTFSCMIIYNVRSSETSVFNYTIFEKQNNYQHFYRCLHLPEMSPYW